MDAHGQSLIPYMEFMQIRHFLCMDFLGLSVCCTDDLVEMKYVKNLLLQLFRNKPLWLLDYTEEKKEMLRTIHN